MKKVFKKIFKSRKEKTENIQGGTIITLISQTSGVDYYDIEINGKEYSRVPCPIPLWLSDQLKIDGVKGFIITDNRRLKVERSPIFSEGESVQIIFENGNPQLPKISLEKSGKKYIKRKIIYI
jgi:hypothetical protein